MGGICTGLNVVEMGAGSIAASITGMVLGAPPALLENAQPPRAPCERGEHNRPVLADAGYSAAEIDRFEATGAVVPPGAVPEHS